MTARSSWPLIVLGFAFLGGCAAPVHYEYNSAPYGQWHDFAWRAPRPQPVRNPLVDSGILSVRVERAVAATLMDRGFRQVSGPARADFLVTYHTTLQKQQRSGASVAFSYGYWAPPFRSVIVSQPRSRVQQADLIVDIIDAKTHELVWRGWTTRSLSQSNYSQQAVDEAVQQILSKFPPP